MLLILLFAATLVSSQSINDGLKDLIVLSPELFPDGIVPLNTVALESTVLCHGLPYPQNFQAHQEVQRSVIENGGIPATILLLDGKIRIGFSDSELEWLASEKCRDSIKVSRRDIVKVLSNTTGVGSTTVAGTMFLSAKAGIRVFATGGIGGVHREVERSMDISADLTELGRTPVAVVSAGIKSILDIPRTLEFLETQGVTVAAYKTDDFPAFFTRSSGHKAPMRFDSPEECALAISLNLQLGLNSGMLIATPVPEEYAMDPVAATNAINKALREAKEKAVTGKEITPFLLSRIQALTDGKALQANIALLVNNAILATKIAVELEKAHFPGKPHPPSSLSCSSQVVAIGGVTVDYIAKLTSSDWKLHSSNPGRVLTSIGGVGKNIAEGILQTCLQFLNEVFNFLPTIIERV